MIRAFLRGRELPDAVSRLRKAIGNLPDALSQVSQVVRHVPEVLSDVADDARQTREPVCDPIRLAESLSKSAANCAC